MVEEKLTAADRKHIFLDLKNSYLAGFGFLAAVLLFMAITHSGFALFDFNHHVNWVKRIFITFGLCLFIFCIVAVSYYNHYLDLITGKKITLTLNKYEIVSKKNNHYLATDIPNYPRIYIDEDHLPHINRQQPLNIQLAKRSELILFISNGANNYLHKSAAA
ncbi:MAG TPA: hypothetical protein VK835_09715 [Bacteroidia bacterium]|jgi:hypothetical protein|nr:hypothetical protein [Bacteroidia bacterium]